jgi:beta-lactam-binding protein with PASTA domain
MRHVLGVGAVTFAATIVVASVAGATAERTTSASAAVPASGAVPILSVVPDVRGDTLAEARAVLTVAGLQLGGVGRTVDCNNLNRVSSQNPAASATAAVGASVSVNLGAPPPRPKVCQ